MGLQEVTEDRIEQLKVAMVSILEERMRTSINQINMYVEESLDSVLDSLQESITKLYHKVAKAQQEQVIGALQFVNVFFMKTRWTGRPITKQFRDMWRMQKRMFPNCWNMPRREEF